VAERGAKVINKRASTTRRDLEKALDLIAKQEVRLCELGGRLERMERVISGMMGQGVYKSDLEVMRKWMGNRWILPVSKGPGLEKKKAPAIKKR
jgi:hypothetical protein